MTANADQLIAKAVTQDGGCYVFGDKYPLNDPDPKSHGHCTDCSGFTRWACAQVGVFIPDGSTTQLGYCQSHRTTVSITQAIRTKGALLFIQTTDHQHVAFSQGNGYTIEARGRAYGVGVFSSSATRGWTHAALVPTLVYGPLASDATPIPPPVVHPPLTPSYAPPATNPMVQPVAGRGVAYKLVKRPGKTAIFALLGGGVLVHIPTGDHFLFMGYDGVDVEELPIDHFVWRLPVIGKLDDINR